MFRLSQRLRRSLTLQQGAEHLKTPIHITPARASQSAIKAIEGLGGSVYCKYYNTLSLRDCVKGRTDRRAAAPTRREDICEHSALFSAACVNSLFSVVHELAESRIPLQGEHPQDAGGRGPLEAAIGGATQVEGAGFRRQEEAIDTTFPSIHYIPLMLYNGNSTCRVRVCLHAIWRYAATARTIGRPRART